MGTRSFPAPYGRLRAAGHVRPVVEVTSWLGADYLGTIDVISGTVSDDEGDKARAQLELTIPASIPAGDTAPVGRAGHVLRVRAGLAGHDQAPVTWADLGHFLIDQVEPADDGVRRLTAVSEGLARITHARFLHVPVVWAAELVSTRLRWIIGGMAPVSFDTRLADRMLTAGEPFEERERIDALWQTVESWPATIEQTGSGLLVRPPYEADGDTPELEYTDGPGGTLVACTTTQPEELPANAVVATSSAEDNNSTATATITVGPYAWGGPYGCRPRFYASPVLTTNAQCEAAARSQLARAQRRAYRVTATLIPDWRIIVGTVVRLRFGTDTDVIARVATVKHPLTAGGGLTEIEAGILEGVIEGQRWTKAQLAGNDLVSPQLIPGGRRVFPAADSGTWTEGRGWRVDTVEAWAGADGVGRHSGAVWWGAGPSGLPGQIVAAAVALAPAVPGPAMSGPLRVHLVGPSRTPGLPAVLASADGPTLGAARTRRDSPVMWQVPAGWLPQLASGAAGGLLFTYDGPKVRISTAGQSGSLQVDWRR